MDKNQFSFKHLFWSYTFCFIPFSLFAGLLSFFNVSPIYFNEAPVYGIKGLLLAILFIPFFGILFGALN